MFNKKETPQSNIKQEEMFNTLIDIFTPGMEKTNIKSKNGAKNNIQTNNGFYTVISKPTRQECVIKEGKSVLFEIYQDNDYLISTRGMYLKHLNLSAETLDYIESSLVYNPRFDMKHGFVIKRDKLVEIVSSFKSRSESINNGLVKAGEIENSSKR